MFIAVQFSSYGLYSRNHAAIVSTFLKEVESIGVSKDIASRYFFAQTNAKGFGSKFFTPHCYSCKCNLDISLLPFL